MTFQLDTSGRVPMPPTEGVQHVRAPWWTWEDLTPFTQGYVRAALESLGEGLPRWNSHDERTEMDHARFSDLFHEALAVMIADCAEITANFTSYASSAAEGRRFWDERQANRRVLHPPQTLSLSDDGKIVLAVAS